MPIDKYFGLGKPDEKQIIEHGDNPLTMLTAAYKEWITYVERDPIRAETPDRFLSKAEEILMPCVGKLPKKMDNTEYFLPLRLYEPNMLAGIFYTALLNSGAIDYLIIPKKIRNMYHFGYRLRRGVLENYAKLDLIGWHAEGGCLINHVRMGEGFGSEATGGLFVNYGKVQPYLFPTSSFGSISKGGVFLDYEHRDFTYDPGGVPPIDKHCKEHYAR